MTGAPRWYVGALGASALVGAVIRALNVLRWRPTCEEDLVARVEQGTEYNPAECAEGSYAIWGDAAYGYLQARLAADGHWFVDGATYFVTGGEEMPPSAGKPPMYTLVLAAWSRLGFTSVTSHRMLSVLLGVAAVILVGLIARRIAGHRAGAIAAAIAAVYPMLWINDGMLLSETLVVPLVAVAILAAYRFWDRPSVTSAVLLGVAVAAAGLTRGEALGMGLVIIPLLWGMSSRSLRQRIGLGAIVAAAALAICAPWFAYNMSRFAEPVLMTSQTGAVLSAANCDSTYYGDRLGYWDDCMAWYIETGRVEAWPSMELDESQRDQVPSDAAMAYMRENLGRLPVVVAARVGRMWDIYRPDESVEFNAVIEGRGHGPSQIGMAMYLVMLPFAVGAAVVLWRRRIPVSPLLIVPLFVTVAAAATFGITRYRAPAEVVLVALAAAGISALVARYWTSRGEDAADVSPKAAPVPEEELT